MRNRTPVTIISLGCLVLLLFLAGLSIGSTMLNPIDVVTHLAGFGNGELDFVIDTLRLPRTLLAVLAGAALGVSGLILQSVIRNPLGSPDILGISGGASFAAVAFITYLAGSVSLLWLPVAAIIGAGTVSAAIYFLAWKNGVSPIRLVLVGIGIAAATGALTTMMLVMGDGYSTQQAYVWMTGSVYGAGWNDVFGLLPWTAAGIPLALLLSRTADTLELGDSAAVGLGVRVQLHRLLLISISVALAGTAVAYAGGIGFVGLIAPHMARKLVNRSFAGLVPVTALLGGLIVMAADIVARTAFLPNDLPAGIFVSAIGAPYFIYLLYKNRHE